MDQKQSVQHFLDLIKRSHRGKFKIYIGMIAGVGKSYRMLQEAHQLLEVGVDVKIGYIETHGRPETEALVAGLPVIPRRKLFYKGKELEEMDVPTPKPWCRGFPSLRVANCSTKAKNSKRWICRAS